MVLVVYFHKFEWVSKAHFFVFINAKNSPNALQIEKLYTFGIQ